MKMKHNNLVFLGQCRWISKTTAAGFVFCITFWVSYAKGCEGGVRAHSNVLDNQDTGLLPSASIRNLSQNKYQEEYQIRGTIRDEENKPLIGVTVSIMGTKVSTTTITDGKYEIRIVKGAKLFFSMVGYERQSIEVESPDPINIILKKQTRVIDEVLVSTGYTKRTKESLTGASTVISRKQLEKFNSNNIFSIIQSLDPAFKIDENIQGGSNPNALPQISIRGTNSVGEYAVNAPLVIMDGFEVPIDRLYDLDVNRIESISLLKDASSTVLYGSRGGNGVLVIETRLPKDGKFTVTYNFNPSMTAVDLSDYNLMNAGQKLEYEKLAGLYETQYSWIENPVRANNDQTMLDNRYESNKANVLRGVNTYWLAQPVESSLSLGHAIRVEGGGNQVRYSIDGNYTDVKGAMRGSGRRRTGAGFNLIYRIPQKITFRNNATFQFTKAYNSPFGSFSLYSQMNPYQPIHDLSGQLISEYNNISINQGETDSFYGEIAYNPLYNAGLANIDYDSNTVLSNNFSFEWSINPNLILRSMAVLDKTIIKGEKYTSPFHTKFLNSEDRNKGEYRLSDGQGMSYSANMNLTYAKSFKKHAFNGTLLVEGKSSDVSNISHLLAGFATDDYVSPGLAMGYAESRLPTYMNIPNRMLATLFTGNYTYDQKYVADISFRRDGSSKFGRNSRYGNFWSAGMAYNLHREAFFKNKFANELRFFLNTGTNSAENFNADMTSSAFTISSLTQYFKEIGLGYNNEGNPDLRWPQIKSWSAGFSGKIWKDRISMSMSYYNKTVDQMVSPITVAPSLGFANNSYFENMGRVRNRGFESALSVKVLENQPKTFNWYLSASANKNRSTLLDISEALRQLNESNLKQDENSIYRQTVYYQEGESLSNIKGVKSLGIDPSSGQELFETKDGLITDRWNARDLKIIGNLEPKLFGTLSTSINYKSWNLQAFFNYTLGGDIYNTTLVDRIENNDPRVNADVRVLEERWKKPGDITFFKGIDNQTKTLLSSRFVQRENYLRLSSLTVNYELPREFLQKYRLERLRVNFSTNDLFRISSVKMERGIDYPYARTFNLGLSLQF